MMGRYVRWRKYVLVSVLYDPVQACDARVHRRKSVFGVVVPSRM